MSKVTSKSNPQKDYAQILFVTHRLSQKEVSAKTGVSEQTISAWVRDNNWKDLRTMTSTTRDEQLRKFYKQLENLNQAIDDRDEGLQYPTSKEADTQRKLSASIRALQNEIEISDIVNVSIKVLEFVRAHNPDKAKEVSEIFDSFIKSCLTK